MINHVVIVRSDGGGNNDGFHYRGGGKYIAIVRKEYIEEGIFVKNKMICSLNTSFLSSVCLRATHRSTESDFSCN